MNPQRASYSYINLLNDCKCNRLYILDNNGHNIYGCYYIGTNGKEEVEPAVNALIQKIRKDNDIKKTVFCGSSKGGHTALNFGLNYPFSSIIIGAPQYLLGYYLSHRRSPELKYVICGESQTYLKTLDEK